MGRGGSSDRRSDKLLILMKPFNSIEVIQLANALTKKWSLARTVKMQLESLSSTVKQRTVELQAANLQLQEHVSSRNGGAAHDGSQDAGAAGFRQKEEFLAIMSHEIFTPMNELFAKVSLLLDGPLNSEQRTHALTIQKCGQDLMSSSRICTKSSQDGHRRVGRKAVNDGAISPVCVERSAW